MDSSCYGMPGQGRGWFSQSHLLLLEKYILRGDETFAVLSRLVDHGKQLFLITNSPFSFV